MDMRELKGLEIAARVRIACEAGVWLVPSQSGNGKYRITLSPPSCECDDFQLRREPCKHIHAARIVRERDGGEKAPSLDTEVIPKRPTYQQNWPLYDQAQMTEKHRFLALLHDLCRGAEYPDAPKIGRHHIPMADKIFTCCLKVYSTFSSRRFACDLRDAHAKRYLSELPHSVSSCAFFKEPRMTEVLRGLIVRSSLPLAAVEANFAPDSSGFSTSRFVRWYDEKYGVERSGRDWVKCHIMTGVKTNIVTAIDILGRDAADCPQFKPLLDKTAEAFTIGGVSADKAYLSVENVEAVAAHGGTAFIAPKANTTGAAGGLFERMFHFYQFRREEFLRHYHQRSNVESTFSMVKAKFRDHVRSKTDVAMRNEVLCKFLCHNICVVHQSHVELGIEPVFWENEPKDIPAILPMVRPG